MSKALRFPRILLVTALFAAFLLPLVSCSASPYANAVPISFSADGVTADGAGISVSTDADGAYTVTISAPGAYRLSGVCENGAVVVDAADEVTLVLDGLTLTHPTGACIASVGEGNLTVHALSGTESALSDGAGYVFPDAVTDEPDAVIFAKSDLTLSGDSDGICHITARYKTGAATKDDLTVTGGNYTVSSVRHGLRGRDSVTVSGGLLAIEAAADGIRTTNDNPGKEGTIAVTGGTVQISAGDEGLQSIADVTISGGALTINSTNNGVKTDAGAFTVTGGSVVIDAVDTPLLVPETIHTGGTLTVNGENASK